MVQTKTAFAIIAYCKIQYLYILELFIGVDLYIIYTSLIDK